MEFDVVNGDSKYGNGIPNGTDEHSGNQAAMETSYWMKNKPKPKKHSDKQVVSTCINIYLLTIHETNL